jgi:hypothetical protein
LNGSNPYEAPRADLAPSMGNGRPRLGRWLFVGYQFSLIHFFYATSAGLLIYMRPGNYTWVSVAWLPGSLLLSEFGSLHNSPLMTLGFHLHPVGSIAAGVVAMQALRALITREGRRRYGWRFWLALLLWFAWIPVPFRGTFFYWFESY